MTIRQLSLLIGSVLAVSVIILVFLVLNEDCAGQQLILKEIEKQLVQLILITFLGGIAGFLFKFYLNTKANQDKEREKEKLRHQGMIEFQSEQIRRLVEVANRLRQAPALIEAHRSAKTYGEQMQAAIDSRLELHRIQHEIELFGSGDKNIAFPAWPEIRQLLNGMQNYLGKLEEEFRDKYKDISELQRTAELDRTKQVEVWERILKLPMIRGLLGFDGSKVEETKFSDCFLSKYGAAVFLMKKEVVRRQSLLEPK